ncbi:GNAT family N-acetyltransferase [Marinimicrobium sp. LS-A18]|uniref:GNAT family N-acetyltransferase n=1 Tax=Marinimicrobium sp. LS-A18 TaxID=1381596 RepID=UPI0004B7E932|nr:GNAT family N-acetyltransferase [Marinimicrobium sp. LS-A18]
MITIRRATYDDVPALHALAERFLLENLKDPENTGFLISNFSLDVYKAYVDSAEYFWVAEEDGKLGGFLLAYKSESIKPEEVINSCLRYSVIQPFTLIKQICSSGEVRGAASALYQTLFDEMDTELALAAVVNEPLNTKSIEYHRKLGFGHLWDLHPPADYDGVTRTRSIWFYSKTGTRPQTRMAQVDRSELVQHLIEKEQGTVNLYMHEDNLNWTKLGMLVTFMTALLTAFGFLLERDPTTTNNWIVSVLVVFGFVVNIMFYLKLKSGLAFLNHHKKNLRRFDDALAGMLPSIPSYLDRKTGKQSVTVRVMVVLPVFSLGLWAVCAGLLLHRYFL